MRFPRAAGGAGQLAPVQESREMLKAEIEDIELVAQRELTSLLVSMPVDPLR